MNMTSARPLPAPLLTVLRHAQGLSPFGPIFGKELRVTARRRRSYVLRVMYLGALLLTLLVAWSDTAGRREYLSVAAKTQALAELGGNFFVSFCMFTVIAMAAIGPVLTSTAVGSERLAKTLHVLLMTPITAWQVVAGKLFSRLLVALTLLGLSLPVLALVRLLGGVELWQMVGIVCLCATTALFTAAIGLLFSTFLTRAYAVILLSYGTILFLYAFVPFVVVAGAGLRAAAWVSVFAMLNPFLCAATVSDPRSFMGVGNGWPWCVLVHLGFTAVLLTGSAVALRRVTRKEGGAGAAEAAPPDAALVEGGADVADGAAPHSAPDPAPVRPLPSPRNRRGSEVSDHPVVWREVRRPLLARKWQSVLASVLAVVLLLVTYGVAIDNRALDHADAHRGYVVVFNGLLWLLTAVLAATAIAQEKEGDTWTLLLTTPLGGRSIVWGKVLGVYRRLLWPAALFVTHLLVFAVAGVIDVVGMLLAVWVMFSFNSVWVATGIYLSLRFQKVTFAVIVNLLLAVTIYLGMSAVLAVGGEYYSYRDLPSYVAWYLPYYYLVCGVSRAWPFWQSGTMRMPGEVKVDYETFCAIGFCVGLTYVLVSTVILSATAAAFDRMVGRARTRRA